MLSRTASNLYWLARYIERAEATARMIGMGQRMSMLPGASGRQEWASVLRATGADVPAGEQPSKSEVINRLLLDSNNPGSIHSCLTMARSNGKAVRTALTQDMWEVLNDGWRYLEGMDEKTALRDIDKVLDWVRQRAAVFRGAIDTSMIRNDAYDFLRLGGYLERADMTLRVLNVKYYVLLPEADVIGGGRDHHQWTSLLRAMSAHRAYHHVYKADYTPWKIADFLIMQERFPRSVAFCYGQVRALLDDLEQSYGQSHRAHSLARAEHDRLLHHNMDDIFQDGLHEFLNERINKTAELSNEIASAYYFQ